MYVCTITDSITFFVTQSTGIHFDDVDDIYASRYDNCTLSERNQMKCLTATSVCVARVDTVERLPLCMCISGYTGARCERSVLPITKECTSISVTLWVLISIIFIAVSLVPFVLKYYTRAPIYTPTTQYTSVGV